MLVTRTAQISTYDFRRPNKLNREHVRALQIVGETFARQLTTVLSTSLRTGVQTTLDDVTQVTHDEFVRDLPSPTLLTVFDIPPLVGSAMFHLPGTLTTTIVERLLGGSGRLSSGPLRAPTEIELRLLRNLLERIFREMAYAFEPLAEVQPTFNRIETNPQFAQVASATDMVIDVAFTVKVEGEPTSVEIAIPFSAIESVLEEAAERTPGPPDGQAGHIQDVLGSSLQRAALDLRVRFDELVVPSRLLADLAPGDVLALEHPTDRPLVVEVEGVPRFLATAGTRGRKVACLITDTTGEAGA